MSKWVKKIRTGEIRINRHKIDTPRKHTVCSTACLYAREIKCVCACGGRYHGLAIKGKMIPLDLIIDDNQPQITHPSPNP